MRVLAKALRNSNNRNNGGYSGHKNRNNDRGNNQRGRGITGKNKFKSVEITATMVVIRHSQNKKRSERKIKIKSPRSNEAQK